MRRKDWLEAYDGDEGTLEDLDLPETERITSRGEAERRRANLATAPVTSSDRLAAPAGQGPMENETLWRGTVIEIATGLYRVRLADAETILCQVRRSLVPQDTVYTNMLAVGDHVLVSRNGSGRGMVETILPRSSMLARPDPFYSHLQQVIAANIDQLLIVASWRDPALWPELVDRYLIAAERNGLTPIICVNKVDLAEDPADPRVALQPYVRLGYAVIFTSAVTGEGMGDLRLALAGAATALAGLSGVGKSSLLAAVEPGLQLRTGEINARRHEGRHTTTQVTMHLLRDGGFVVDTPGIREFGLSGLKRGDLSRFYPEIAARADACQYRDCSHTREPGCAIRAAVNEGRIARVRYENYRKIWRALPSEQTVNMAD